MSKRSPPDEGRYELGSSVGYLLNRAAHLIAARFGDDLKQHTVNLHTWRMLAALSQGGQQSMSQLADHTGAELSYLSRSVASLEHQGLVQRSPSPTDRREACLSLTERGWGVVRELAPKARSMDRLSVRDVPAEDLEATLRTLRAMSINLVAGDDDSRNDVNRKLTVARRVRRRAQSLASDATPPTVREAASMTPRES